MCIQTGPHSYPPLFERLDQAVWYICLHKCISFQPTRYCKGCCSWKTTLIPSNNNNNSLQTWSLERICLSLPSPSPSVRCPSHPLAGNREEDRDNKHAFRIKEMLKNETIPIVEMINDHDDLKKMDSRENQMIKIQGWQMIHVIDI